MKNRLLAYVAFLVFMLGSIATTSKPSTAQNRTFYCDRDGRGKPATLVKTNRADEIPLIIWEIDYFSRSGYTPQKRCEDVSDRFERYHLQGLMNYITTGVVNGYPVICAAKNKRDNCLNQTGKGVLFTLRKKEDDPEEILLDLLEARDSGNTPVRHALNAAQSYSNGRLYINVEAFLSVAPTKNER